MLAFAVTNAEVLHSPKQKNNMIFMIDQQNFKQLFLVFVLEMFQVRTQNIQYYCRQF